MGARDRAGRVARDGGRPGLRLPRQRHAGENRRLRAGALELVCAGPRAAHLEARAPSAAAVSLVISAGVCGALAPDLVEGDLVVPEVVVCSPAMRHPTAALPGLRRAGTMVTVDAVV